MSEDEKSLKRKQVMLTTAQIEFVDAQGNASEYIRGLIDKAMNATGTATPGSDVITLKKEIAALEWEIADIEQDPTYQRARSFNDKHELAESVKEELARKPNARLLTYQSYHKQGINIERLNVGYKPAHWSFEENEVPGWTVQSLRSFLRENGVELQADPRGYGTTNLPVEVALKVLDRIIRACEVEVKVFTEYNERLEGLRADIDFRKDKILGKT